jgi:hypothetical protein
MDTRSQDYAIPEGAVRNAVDVDLDNSGHFRRRKGYTRVVDIPNPHSLFSCPLGTFFAAGSGLYKFNDDNTTTLIYSGIAGPLTYQFFYDTVYFSDGVSCYKFSGALSVTLWGLTTPASSPVLEAVAGSLAPSSFLGAVSFVTASGEESGVSPLAEFSTFSPSGIRFTGLPTAPESSITAIRLYLSTPGGTVLYRVGEVPLGTAYYDVTDITDTGAEADTAIVTRPQPCSILRYHRGRMYMVSGNVVWYSDPYYFSRIRLASNFWQLPADITIFEPVEAGIWVVADKTYFYEGGGTDDFKVLKTLDYGAVPGTSVRLPHGEGVAWQSERGLIVASETGKSENMQESLVTPIPAESGASLLREKDGLRQIITALRPPMGSNQLGVTSFMEAEVIRKGS